MEVKEVEEEENSHKDPRPESGGDSSSKNFPTHLNSSPYRTNKVKKNLVCTLEMPS